MNKDKIIKMIDEHLEEPHSICQDWVVALETCKQALIENENLKAEVVRLEFDLSAQRVFNLTNPKTVAEVAKYYISNEDTIRAEAIKEFAERLKKQFKILPYFKKSTMIVCDIVKQTIDNLVKEMVGENSDR